MTEKKTALDELIESLDKMTREEWQTLMVSDKLDEGIIQLLELVGRQRGWLN